MPALGPYIGRRWASPNRWPIVPSASYSNTEGCSCVVYDFVLFKMDETSRCEVRECVSLDTMT